MLDIKEFPITTPNETQVNNIINITFEQGEPIIYCNKKFAYELINLVMKPYHSKMDWEEVRDYGYIGKYKGTPIYIVKTFPINIPYGIVVPIFKYKGE